MNLSSIVLWKSICHTRSPARIFSGRGILLLYRIYADFNTTILLTSVLAIIIGNGRAFSEANCADPGSIDSSLHKRIFNTEGSPFGKCLIIRRRTSTVGMPFNTNGSLGVIDQYLGYPVQFIV